MFFSLDSSEKISTRKLNNDEISFLKKDSLFLLFFARDFWRVSLESQSLRSSTLWMDDSWYMSSCSETYCRQNECQVNWFKVERIIESESAITFTDSHIVREKNFADFAIWLISSSAAYDAVKENPQQANSKRMKKRMHSKLLES